MKNKQSIRNFLFSFLAVLIFASISMGIQINTRGMALNNIPKAKDVVSVTINYPTMSEESKEITDPQFVEYSVNMTDYLRYEPSKKVEDEEPLVSFCYQLSNGEEIEVSANRTAVFYQGKVYKLKNPDSFINMTEGIFFGEN